MAGLAPLVLLVLLGLSAAYGQFSGSWAATSLPQPFVPTIQYQGCSDYNLTSLILQVGPAGMIPAGKFGWTASFDVLFPSFGVSKPISMTAMGDVSFPSPSTGSFQYNSIQCGQSPTDTQSFCSLCNALLINFEATDDGVNLAIPSWAGQTYALTMAPDNGRLWRKARADYYDSMEDAV